MLSDQQMVDLTQPVTPELIQSVFGLNNEYYLAPLDYITNKLHLKLPCSGQEYRHAVEMANDEDTLPADGGLDVVVDGILAYVFAEQLEACGIDLTTYFTYRFHPPSQEFQNRLDAFEDLINECKVVVE